MNNINTEVRPKIPDPIPCLFSYTGAVQCYTVAKDGIYKLEVWGAQGGCSVSHGRQGGLGGYSIGCTCLSKGTILYIYVGGAGVPGIINVPGGWNGGGGITNEIRYNSNSCHLGTGGGATDISTVCSNMTLDSYNRYVRSDASYNGRIIVAGGGGGAESGNGSAGGGLCGCGGVRGGTQTAAGCACVCNASSWVTLYVGGKGYGMSTSGGHHNHAMGSTGGGGYYGGGGFAYNGNSSYGGGGSGYIGGLTGGTTSCGINCGNGCAYICFIP